MQIYTRVGDKGKTKLIGGQEVRKDNIRVKAYGSIDELNSVVGLTRSFAGEWPELQAELQLIQQLLFDCGNDFATPDGIYPYRLNEEDIKWLEARIDVHAVQAPEVTSFILPGGTQLASYLHLARTVTRRVERDCVTYINEEPYNAFALKFINRLSDYFFAVARVANAKFGVNDILYERSGAVFHPEITKNDIPE